MAMSTRAERRRAARAPTPPRTARRRWPLLLAAAALTATVLAALLGLPGGESLGALSAQRTEHDFGVVRMADGLLSTGFPLTVEGAVDVTDLGTT